MSKKEALVRKILFWLYAPIVLFVMIITSVFVAVFIMGYDIVNGHYKDILDDISETYLEIYKECKPIAPIAHEIYRKYVSM